MQKRFSVFYGVGCVVQSFAGILAFGLMQMDGIQGLAGWRWIFILEGVVSCYVKTEDTIKALTVSDHDRPWPPVLRSHCGLPGQGS